MLGANLCTPFCVVEPVLLLLTRWHLLLLLLRACEAEVGAALAPRDPDSSEMLPCAPVGEERPTLRGAQARVGPDMAEQLVAAPEYRHWLGAGRPHMDG